MVGRPMKATAPGRAPRRIGHRILEVKRLSRTGEFQDVSFHVCAGEIVALAGLVGSGRTAVVETLFGITRPDSGQVFIDGRPVRVRHPREAMRHGLALVPEDRQVHGLFTSQSVLRNATACIMNKLSKFGWLDDRRGQRAGHDCSRS